MYSIDFAFIDFIKFKFQKIALVFPLAFRWKRAGINWGKW